MVSVCSKEAAPDNAVLQIKSLEAFAKAADGQGNQDYYPIGYSGDCRTEQIHCGNCKKKTDNTDTSVMHWTKLLHENGAVFCYLRKVFILQKENGIL